MNIKESKDEIKNAMTAYFTKDELGNYVIPIEKQRPVFLMGPPGIGKTAIMEQIAQELGVGLLSYSMTHHTRQSALGLPFIQHKIYAGQEYEITEYTMSEIIASVYDVMEETGIKEGILFLDEVNCVSETLAPAMLQFLQYKVFGRHRVPEGWLVVTAGNPPEYNNSVREFDIVTWDRLKRIDVQPDYSVWKEFALNQGVHPAVTTYLDIKRDDFYLVETTVDGKCFVTARGWDDLSTMIKLYERKRIPVQEPLVSQYLQQKRIAKDFAVYYDLFNKYRSDYQVDKILDGTVDKGIIDRARVAKFDERLALIGLLLDQIHLRVEDISAEENTLQHLVEILREIRTDYLKPHTDYVSTLEKHAQKVREQLSAGRVSGSVSPQKLKTLAFVLRILEGYRGSAMTDPSLNGRDAFAPIKVDYDRRLRDMKKEADNVAANMNNMFGFAESAFGEGQEILILVTELTLHNGCAHFISRYGCEKYFQYNKELLFYERHKTIVAEIEQLNI